MPEQEPQRSPANTEETVSAEESSGILSRVVRQTLLGDDSDSSGTSDQPPSWLLVLHQHASGPPELDTVEQMVKAILRRSFSEKWLDESQLSRMSARIADSLWNDPICRPRIDLLWKHAREMPLQ